jgi:hypothetical protein
MRNNMIKTVNSNDKAVIFLSHKSDDKEFADILEEFVSGLGVRENQLIYTTHPLHKIPFGHNTYDYLRENINNEIFMIFLISEKYLDSAACLSEMGAAWAMRSDYACFFIPDFNFNNPKFQACPIDTKKIGIILNGDMICKAGIIEFKNKILSLFNLPVSEAKSMFLIDKVIEQIKRVKNARITNHTDNKSCIDIDALTNSEMKILRRFFSKSLNEFSPVPQIISAEVNTSQVVRKLCDRNILEDLTDAERFMKYDGFGVSYSLNKDAVIELNKIKDDIMGTPNA